MAGPDLNAYRRMADAAVADFRHAARTVAEERANLAAARDKLQDALKAQSIIQGAAQAVQQRAHAQVARVVTKCVRTVGWDYEFRINFERKRGKTEARLVFVRSGVEIDPTGAAGGGVVDVAALALRLAAVLLSTPRRRRLLVLDEPLKQVSREYIGQCRELLETLAKELNFQFLMVTHDRDLACGKVVEIGGTP